MTVLTSNVSSNSMEFSKLGVGGKGVVVTEGDLSLPKKEALGFELVGVCGTVERRVIVKAS